MVRRAKQIYRRTSLAGVALLVLLAEPFFNEGLAHHSRAAFNLEDKVEIEGRVVEVAWTNPHYYLGVELDDGTGTPTRWTFEGHSIPGLVRNGWSRKTLTVGSRVVVVASPNRNPETLFGLLDHVTRADGQTFFSFRPRPEVAAQAKSPLAPSTDFSGTWRIIRSLRDNLVGGFAAPSDWPLTELGVAELANFNINDDPSLRCEPRGLPRMLGWPYAQQWRIDAAGLHISIEHAVEERSIPFLVAASATGAQTAGDPLGLGTSVARRVAPDVLEIRSAEFTPRFWGITRGISSSGAKELLERYELIDGGYKLKLTYTVADTEYLAEPVSESYTLQKVHDYTFAGEPDCDVGTAQRHLQFES